MLNAKREATSTIRFVSGGVRPGIVPSISHRTKTDELRKRFTIEIVYDHCNRSLFAIRPNWNRIVIMLHVQDGDHIYIHKQLTHVLRPEVEAVFAIMRD